MATISSAGIGSGLDVQSIVSKLVALERRPLAQLQTQGNNLSSRISSWGTVRSQLSAMQEASRNLTASTNWNSRNFASSNTNAITGTASASAAAGSYTVSVTALAQQQVVRTSNGIASTAGIGQTGSLEISLGTWAGNTFTDASSPVTLAVNATDTIGTIAQNINSLNIALTATVVRSGGEDNLILRSKETGQAQGFQIRAIDDNTGRAITSGTGLGALAYGFDTDSNAFYGMSLSQSARNATATIEGVEVSSPTNTLSDAVSGLSLQLVAPTTTPVTVTVTDDVESTKSNIRKFVDAYNTLVTSLAQFTRFDQATKTAGPLQGDSTAVGMLNTLKRMVGAVGPAGTTFTRMSDVGLELERNGTLSIDSARLDRALENRTDLRTFFSATSTEPTAAGLAQRFFDYAFGAIASQGQLTGRTTALQRAAERNTEAIDRMNERIQRTEARLLQTYSALDTKMSSLNALSSFVAQQITTWNQSK